MITMLQLFLLLGSVAGVLLIGYNYLGSSFVIWIAAGIAVVGLGPFPLPDLTDPLQLLTWGVAIALYLFAWVVFVKPP